MVVHVNMIESACRAFNFGQIQDAATLLKTLAKQGISTDDFLTYVGKEKRRRVQARKRIEKRRAEIERRLPKCPSCGIAMILRPAGEDPEDGSHWTCPKCRFGRYDPRASSQILEILDIKYK